MEWSMRHVTWSKEHAVQALDALTLTVEQVCMIHFPASAGYQTSCATFSGGVEGRRVVIVGDEFEALVSAQCFDVSTSSADTQREVRVVAVVRRTAAERAPTSWLTLMIERPGWTVLLCSGLFFALMFQLWVPGIEGYYRLSLMMSFLIMMAPAIAWIIGARAGLRLEALETAGPSVWASLPPAWEPEQHSRWQALARCVHDQQRVVDTRRSLPFRR